MLSTTVVHRCRHCGSERLRKNGHANNGAQRAKCLECGRTFHLEPKGPRYDEKFKAQVLSAYQDRMSIPGHHPHLRRLLPDRDGLGGGEKVAALPAFEDTLLPSQTGDVLELDELWSFVQQKNAGVLAVAGALPQDPPDRCLHGRRPQPGRGDEFARARS